MRRAAWIYLALTVVVCCFHLAMAAGAPWGHLTMGGQWPGVFPGPLRIVAVVNAALLAGLAVIVLGRAGVVAVAVPGWAVWGVVAFLGLGVFVHIITPSAAERAVWLPQLLVMLVCAVVVARGR